MRQSPERFSLQPGRVTVAQAVAWYIRGKSDLDARTVDALELVLGRLADFAGDDAKIAGVTPFIAEEWRSALLADEGLSPATVARHVKAARALFDRAIRAGLLNALNPFALVSTRAPRAEGRAVHLTELECDLLVGTCPVGPWRALVGLAAYAGLRRGECLRLAWGDVDAARRRVCVRAKTGHATTKSRARETLLEDRLLATLETCRPGAATPADLVAPVEPGSVTRGVIALIRGAGFDPWPAPLHALRGNRARLWRDAGFPEYVVDSWLGHSLEVARRHYVRVPDAFYRPGITAGHPTPLGSHGG